MLVFLAWIGLMVLGIAAVVLTYGENVRIGPFEIAYVGLPEPRMGAGIFLPVSELKRLSDQALSANEENKS